MSRRGCCYDNAVMERFSWSLKQEWTNHESFAVIDKARLSMFRYIETFYNSRRLYQSLGYQSPSRVTLAWLNCTVDLRQGYELDPIAC